MSWIGFECPKRFRQPAWIVLERVDPAGGRVIPTCPKVSTRQRHWKHPWGPPQSIWRASGAKSQAGDGGERGPERSFKLVSGVPRNRFGGSPPPPTRRLVSGCKGREAQNDPQNRFRGGPGIDLEGPPARGLVSGPEGAEAQSDPLNRFRGCPKLNLQGPPGSRAGLWVRGQRGPERHSKSMSGLS